LKQKAAVRLKHSSKTNPGWLKGRKSNIKQREQRKMNQLAAQSAIRLHLVRKAG
jgi:hypothetical protein